MKDIAGMRFGRLIAIMPNGKANDGAIKWLCKCDCGNEKTIEGRHLRNGTIKSCGCLLSETSKENVVKAHNAVRKHFGCINCGSDKHYAKGFCRNCYMKYKRGTLE